MRPRRSVTVRANAKVNLFLKVKGLRPDGYHEIETVYHSISLSDTITVSASRGGVSVVCGNDVVPLDATNLAARAAEAVVALAARRGGSRGVPGMKIEIEKEVPVGSGLGGGSADAAGALVAANRLGGLGLATRDLETAAEGIGADVKFMLRGGCAIGRGRGDQLERIEPLPPLPVVVVVPPVTVSTTWAYGSLKIPLTTGGTSLNIIAGALKNGEILSLRDVLENDFERLIFDRHPEIGRIKYALLGMGARVALLSGSGSAVFGIFAERRLARACCEVVSHLGLEVFAGTLAARGVTTPR
jgi:4-diphosphocytidyl-2-C-methyl-D-erythritol kinase